MEEIIYYLYQTRYALFMIFVFIVFFVMVIKKFVDLRTEQKADTELSFCRDKKLILDNAVKILAKRQVSSDLNDAVMRYLEARTGLIRNKAWYEAHRLMTMCTSLGYSYKEYEALLVITRHNNG